jgi:hypothetical protein
VFSLIRRKGLNEITLHSTGEAALQIATKFSNGTFSRRGSALTSRDRLKKQNGSKQKRQSKNYFTSGGLKKGRGGG